MQYGNQARLGTARGAVRSLGRQVLTHHVKQRLLSALVWTVTLYGCKTWTLEAVDKRQIQGFEMTAYRRLDGTSDQCISAERSTTTGTPADNLQRRPSTSLCDQSQKPMHRNTGRKNRWNWKEKTRQAEAKMDR